MPRKKIARKIPPLPKIPRLRQDEHKTERLLKLLRDIAVRIQTPEAQLFYPLREIAQKFRVPVSLAGKVYRELEREGILRRIRGSGTVLQGVNPTRKLSVRGVIAIASSLAC